jgi:hypothetical protein
MLPVADLTTGDSPFRPTHIVAGGPGFVAAGEIEGPDFISRTAAAWYSADGVAWRQAVLPGIPTGSNAFSIIEGLVVVQGQVIAVGRYGDSETDSLVAWTSTDGVNWMVESLPSPPTGTLLALEGAVSEGSRVVVYGASHLLWVRNPDGTWTIVPFKTSEECAIHTVRSTMLGFLLLGDCSEPGSDDPTRAEIYKFDGEGAVQDLRSDSAIVYPTAAASIGATTLLLGYEADGLGKYRPVYAVADDGDSDWLQARTLPIPDDVLQIEVSNVNVVGDAYIVTGLAAGAGAIPQPVIWVTTDFGSSWEHHLLPAYAEDGWIESVAENDGRVVMLANRGVAPDYTDGVVVNFSP